MMGEIFGEQFRLLWKIMSRWDHVSYHYVNHKIDCIGRGLWAIMQTLGWVGVYYFYITINIMTGR